MAKVAPPARAASLTRLESSLDRLDHQVRRWSPTRWAGMANDGRLRSEVAYALALRLAELARQAGNGAPDIAPAAVLPHAIADQLAVLGSELLAAPTAADTAEAAAAAVEEVTKLL